VEPSRQALRDGLHHLQWIVTVDDSKQASVHVFGSPSVPIGAFYDIHQVGELFATEHRIRIERIASLLFPKLCHAVDIRFDDGKADRLFEKRVFVSVRIRIEFRVSVIFLDIRILRIPKSFGG
jgi:hypothetical protein